MKTLVGHAGKDPFTIYIGRTFFNRGLKRKFTDLGFGNPHKISETVTREQSIALHRADLHCDPVLLRKARIALTGEVLGCWCRRLGVTEPPCHGDNYVEVCEASEEEFRVMVEAAERAQDG